MIFQRAPVQFASVQLCSCVNPILFRSSNELLEKLKTGVGLWGISFGDFFFPFWDSDASCYHAVCVCGRRNLRALSGTKRVMGLEREDADTAVKMIHGMRLDHWTFHLLFICTYLLTAFSFCYSPRNQSVRCNASKYRMRDPRPSNSTVMKAIFFFKKEEERSFRAFTAF